MSANPPKIEDLFSGLPSAKIVFKVQPSADLPSPRLLFEAINDYSAVPFTRVLLGAAQAVKEAWLEECLKPVDFNGKCYVFVIQYGWHWFEVESLNAKEWILTLLLHEDVDDFMVLSQNVAGFLGFIEDEAQYLAFVSKNVR